MTLPPALSAVLDNPLVQGLGIYTLLGRIITHAWIPPEFFNDFPRFQRVYRVIGKIVKYLFAIEWRQVIWGEQIRKRTGQTGQFKAIKDK